MQQLQLWARDSVYKKIELDEPKLASWNANADPGQMAVQRYLDDIGQELNPLLKHTGPFRHIEIDVKEREHL